MPELRSVKRRLDEIQMNEQEQILDGVVSVAEVLAYIERDGYLDLPQAATYLSLSERYIRKHLSEIPHYRVGPRKLLFRRSELDQWMKQWQVQDLDLDRLTQMAEELLA